MNQHTYRNISLSSATQDGNKKTYSFTTILVEQFSRDKSHEVSEICRIRYVVPTQASLNSRSLSCFNKTAKVTGNSPGSG
jgi:hypothetical protein